jgi:hypothetical protein
MPLAAMTAITSGGGCQPRPSSPAEATGVVTPRAANRADSMAWAMTDRQTFAVQSRRISVTVAIQSLIVNIRVRLARNRRESGGTEDG